MAAITASLDVTAEHRGAAAFGREQWRATVP
jgi:hypothetical protein